MTWQRISFNTKTLKHILYIKLKQLGYGHKFFLKKSYIRAELNSPISHHFLYY